MNFRLLRDLQSGFIPKTIEEPVGFPDDSVQTVAAVNKPVAVAQQRLLFCQ